MGTLPKATSDQQNHNDVEFTVRWANNKHLAYGLTPLK